MAQPIVLFDINETVLNLATLQPKFSATFGSTKALKIWFSQLLHTSTVCISTKIESDFATLAAISLDSVAMHFDIRLNDSTKKELLSGFAQLSAHDDVKPALSLLKEHGIKTVAFSNSSMALISKQITNAGLDDYFDDILSVESTGSFKPDPKVYHFACKTLNTEPNKLRLVATHDWDTHGAMSAGLQAAYIARAPAVYNPLYLQPDIQGATMVDIANQILEAAD
ncbi:haloacid dehalogenase type II [Vibrio ulleungensis]|uniref:(S)-2-haloacid dehalogenase n=1 Tax=Vibrio ulleungensis TaxID=2807619 RepID=A0ABS2HG72_9VIBR|nr:haloacid dehalogenase type II [Vibrio ulleungensis]MBM7034827.1 haloacid dehalogenase type II [Vibrio ulleungensis]